MVSRRDPKAHRVTFGEVIEIATAAGRLAAEVAAEVREAKAGVATADGKIPREVVVAIVRRLLTGKPADALIEAIADAVED